MIRAVFYTQRFCFQIFQIYTCVDREPRFAADKKIGNLENLETTGTEKYGTNWNSGKSEKMEAKRCVKRP